MSTQASINVTDAKSEANLLIPADGHWAGSFALFAIQQHKSLCLSEPDYTEDFSVTSFVDWYMKEEGSKARAEVVPGLSKQEFHYEVTLKGGSVTKLTASKRGFNHKEFMAALKSGADPISTGTHSQLWQVTF